MKLKGLKIFKKEEDPIKRKNFRFYAIGCFVGTAAGCASYNDFLSALFFLMLALICEIYNNDIDKKERMNKNE